MNKITLKAFFIALMLSPLLMSAQEYSVTLFNNIVFYDGYATPSTLPTPEGIVRIDNSRYAKKLSDQEMDGLLKTFEVQVKIGALCDNYDRIGGVFVSLVPKGQPVTSADKQTIEVGRFITPFMNKNKMPDEVPYQFELHHLLGLFKDQAIRQEYDIWFELYVFGVPYAANTQVAGCAGRNDVFEGTLILNSSNTGYDRGQFFIKPLANNINFNNYNATDVPGTTTRIINFELDNPISEGALHLITSNHGANAGGEEYVRRQHYVYFDDQEVLTYKPGGKSCEPYRYYNTQGNMIYGTSPKTEAQWTSWNNWCPGDVIPNRIIDLGDVDAGSHTFKINVPAAVFTGGEGNFPLSLFFFSQDVEGTVSIEDIKYVDYSLYPNPSSDFLTVNASEKLREIVLYDLSGKQVLQSTANTLDISILASGMYVAKIKFENGVETTEKIVKK
ncbi:peptide-N-glycosidase F-related protein [Paenimyroides ceti]